MDKGSLSAGALLAMTVAGCAGAATEVAAPVKPVAQGRAVMVSQYDFVVDGRAGGRLAVLAGGLRGDRLRVGLLVDNQSDRRFTVPLDEVYLLGFGAPLRVVAIADRKSVPRELMVPAHASRAYTLVFEVSDAAGADGRRAVQLHWAVDVDGARARVDRATALLVGRADVLSGRCGDQLRTYSKSKVWPLMPRVGGAIQLAILPRS